MIKESKVIVDDTFDLETEKTPFGKRWGGQTIKLSDTDLNELRNGKLIALDIQNEYIVYLQLDKK